MLTLFVKPQHKPFLALEEASPYHSKRQKKRLA